MKTFFIETYGCQMNKAESTTLIQSMTEHGFIETLSKENSDIVIINTCSVRKTAENRIWGRLGYYKSLKRTKDIILVITGCMSQRIGEELINSNFGIDYVVGNFFKDKIPSLIKNRIPGDRGLYIDEKEVVFPVPMPEESNPAKAYVTITHGCNNFCSYCIVPYVRGREVSKDSKEIVDDINKLYEQGVRQVMLLGQNVNSYGLDKKDLNFPDLLKMIIKETEMPWIKFMSSHPKDLSDELIEVIATEDRISKWVHLALQSGSNKILGLMNRKYTREDFKGIVDRLRSKSPDIVITTDIIIGFPGETEEDYHDTLNLIRDIRFDDAFMYKYNERDTTLAQTKWDDNIDDDLKVKRLTELINVQRVINHEKRKDKIGMTFEVLPERYAADGKDLILGIVKEEFMILYSGGSEEDFGKLVKVKAISSTGSSLKGIRI